MRWRVSGGSHGAGASRSCGVTGGQSSTRPAWPRRNATCADGRGGLEGDAVAGGLEREDGVHRVQHGGGGAEGDFQVDLVPAAFGQLDSGLEMAAHAGELGGVGALEAVDRLLLVADREDRADSVGAGGVGEELLGQRGDHLPLLRVGVLRLVDQDVVEAAVELEQHPGGDAFLGSRCCAARIRSS